MKGRKILFVDDNAKSRRNCVKILAATQADVTAPKSTDEARELVENNFFDIVFADFNCREILEIASSKSPFSKTILLAQVAISDILSYVHQEKYISNFLAKDVDGQIMPEDLLMTTEKILRNDIFGIEKYLCWGIEPFTYQIDDSNRRMKYIERMASYCKEIGCRDSMIRILVDLCDEFLMNAIYDAPRDKEGNPIYANTPRNERVLLKPDQATTFRYASDGELLAISVEDAFGAITREKVVSYLRKCFGKGDDQIDSKEGGAGLGLYIIWKSVNHFILNIDPGVRTEFVGIIDLSLSIREFKTRNRSFHLFNTQSHL